jgi:hypothetical protein
MNLAKLPPLGQKAPNLISSTLRQSARGQPCSLRLPCCNHDRETTVLAHLRFFSMAGMGHKPPDWFAVYACSACHDAIDRRSDADVSQWEFEDLLRALGETLKAHFAAGRLTEGSDAP